MREEKRSKLSLLVTKGLLGIGMLGMLSLPASWFAAYHYYRKSSASSEYAGQLEREVRLLSEENEVLQETIDTASSIYKELEQSQTQRSALIDELSERYDELNARNQELREHYDVLSQLAVAQADILTDGSYIRVLDRPFDLSVSPILEKDDLSAIVDSGYVFSDYEKGVLLNMSGNIESPTLGFANGFFISDSLFMTVAHGSLEFSGRLGVSRVDTGDDVLDAYLAAYSVKLDLALYMTDSRTSRFQLRLGDSDDCDTFSIYALERVPDEDDIYRAITRRESLSLRALDVGDLEGDVISRMSTTGRDDVIVQYTTDFLRLNYPCRPGNSGSPVHSSDFRLMGIVRSVDGEYTFATPASKIREFIDACVR